MTKNLPVRPLLTASRLLERAARLLARRSLASGMDRSRIHPSALVAYNRISMKPSCSLHIDEQSLVEGFLSFERDEAAIRIGKRTFMNGHVIAADSVSIGDDVLVSWGVTIVDHNSHSPAFSRRSRDVLLWREQRKDWSAVEIRPVTVSDKAWIGFNAIVLCGVTIGEGAVIGAGSVVTHDVPAWSVAAGNPARVIRDIPSDER